MLPGAGALPDGVNAALYAAEGDLVNAGLSAAAAVPGIGDGATAAKYAAKYGDEVAAIAKTAGDFCSFRADTAVLTPDGLTPIAAINVGDHVLAYHEGLHTTGTYTVTAVWAHRDPVVVTLLLDDEVIETTPEHPFFVAGRGWTPAGALVAGSTIQQADGTTGVVHAMQMEHRSQVMYNFTVAEAHTYFVGEGSWLVHNACLRSNIGAGPGEQAHHLIPNQRRNHPVVQAATTGGWDQHGAQNGMALPDSFAGSVNRFCLTIPVSSGILSGCVMVNLSECTNATL
jgi:hypothetical protein